MTRPQPETGRFWSDLRTLLGSFPAGTRPRFVAFVLAQVVVGLMEFVGLAAVLPIIQVMTGADLTSGYLGTLYGLLGEPSRTTFVLIAAAGMVGAFLVKAIIYLSVNWWSTGFVSHLQVRTSSRVLEHYLHEPYLKHRQRELGEMMRRIDGAVGDAHGKVLSSLLGLTSAALSMSFILALLLVVMPLPTLAAIGYFGVVVAVVQQILARANRGADQAYATLTLTGDHQRRAEGLARWELWSALRSHPATAPCTSFRRRRPRPFTMQ